MADQQVETAIARTGKALDALYGLYTIGKQERDFSVAKLTELGELESHTNTRTSIALFKDLGILDRIMEYGSPANGMTPGRHFHMTLIDTHNTALAKFNQWAEQRRADSVAARAVGNKKSSEARKGKPIGTKKERVEAIARYNGVTNTETTVIAAQTSDADPVAAISGPESNFTMRAALKTALRESGYTIDESNALVEAARQYAGRTRKMREKLTELGRVAADMGIDFDLDKVMLGMSFKPDETMEVVSLALPYIARLESTIERQAEQIVEQRRKLSGYDEMRRENEGLRGQNRRLISERVGVQNQQGRA